MPPKQKHRKPVIDSAVKLFRRKGYAATGLNDIVDDCGAPKGSLYHYFPEGKSSIAAAAVEEAGHRVRDTLIELERSSRSTEELIKGHAKLLGKWMKQSGFKDGCPITTVLLELAPEDRGVTMAGKRAYVDRNQILRDRLMKDGIQNGDAERLASLCTSAIQGALIEARVQRSSKPLETAADELSKLVESYLSRSAVRRFE